MHGAKIEVADLISKASSISKEEILALIETPPSPELGDFSLPCFRLAGKLKKEPKMIAEELKQKIKLDKGAIIKEIKVAGPYLNFFLDDAKIAGQVIQNVLKRKEKFGSLDLGKGRQAVLDVIGLNPNKPGHIGHVRNGSIGDSLARVYRFAGFGVNTQSFINDQGLPTAMTFYAYKNLKGKLPKREGYLKKEDHWQGAVYALMEKLMELHPQIKKEVEELQYALEHNKDMKLVREQREFIEKCKAAQSKTWNRLNAGFDLGVHESDLTGSGVLEKTFALLKSKGVLYVSGEEKTQDCLVLKLSQFDFFQGMLSPDKILVRADGRATYTGKDVGMQFWRFNLVPDLMKYKIASRSKGHTEWSTNNLSGKKIEHRFNKNTHCIHIVAAEQKYVIAVDYYALKAAGYEKEFGNCYHLATGLVGFGGEAKISSREGVAGLSADEILDKARELALKEVGKRNPKLDEKKVKELAERIGVGAVRYYLLRTEPTKFIQFSFEDACSFEGNTGPYLQYALVRAKKILAKAKGAGKAELSLLAAPEEGALVKKIAGLPDVVGSAVQEYNPSLIASYAFELANLFSSFYEKCPVLKADSRELRNARLALVKAFAQTLKNALYLLGIEEVDVM